MRRADLQAAGGLAALVALLAIIYGPDLGAGLSKDDFAWVAHSRLTHGADLRRLILTAPTGFYRPVVHLTFAANHALFGLHPLGYALTNGALLILALAGVHFLCRTLELPRAAAVAGAAVWALNPHGINMATLWVSGRTALILVCLAVLTAILFVRRSAWSAVVCLLALLSKEEALLLPAVLFVWAVIDEGPVAASGVWTRALRRTGPLVLVTLVYLILRARSGAFTLATAPDFYRPTFEATAILRNVLEYLDRGATFAVFVSALCALAAQTWPRLDDRERRTAARGVAWFVGGYGLTVVLPVRSNLYACLPSVGAALVAACALTATWRQAPPARRRLMPLVALVPVLALPLYWSRNVRHVRDARFASRVREALQRDLPAIRGGRPVILHDDPAGELPAGRAFVFAFPEAVRLWSGNPQAMAWIDPPPPGWEAARLRPPPPGADAIHFVVEGAGLHRH